MSKRPFTIGEELKKAGVPGMDTGLEQIEYIPIDKIDPDDRNFYSVGDVSELAASIEMVGLQQPLRVRSGERGHVTVVSGHRRRAAILLIRDGGSTMFERGVPCIRERGDVSKEWQELKLIYGNSATRILTASEISIQSEKVTEILDKLEEQGVKFPGRTRDHVAAILQISKSRVGRLHAIRANLVPELLQEFDGGGLGETVAYRLSQEDAAVQHDLAARLGPAVRGLTGDSAEKVLGQIKQPLVTRPPEPVPSQSASPTAPPEGEPSDGSRAIDSLKRYLDEREKEDREFWKLMQEITDDLLLRSFSADAGLSRKENIDTMRLDLRNKGHYGPGFPGWTGINKGIAVGMGQKIARTWTEVYDAVAAIAINRYRQAMVDEKARRNARPRKDVPAVGTKPTWQTGTPPRDGRYFAQIDMQDGRIHETAAEYRGGNWFVFNSPLHLSFKVIGWWPLPGAMKEEA